jgi:hypothetical protein
MLAFRNSVNFTRHDAARPAAATNDHVFGPLQMGRAVAAARSKQAEAAFRRRSSGRAADCLKPDHKRLCSAERRYLRVHTDVAKGLQWAKTKRLEGILPNY